jgi:hypothetical protein
MVKAPRRVNSNSNFTIDIFSSTSLLQQRKKTGGGVSSFKQCLMSISRTQNSIIPAVKKLGINERKSIRKSCGIFEEKKISR